MRRRKSLLLLCLFITGSSCALFSLSAFAAPLKADKILVEKSIRMLSLYYHGKLVRSYSVALGNTPIGDKVYEGDGKTPEGKYKIDFHKPNSAYHRALHITYPNTADSAQAKAVGKSAGGDIMIHGLPNGKGWLGQSSKKIDWTNGCIALTNIEIEEIYAAVPNGTLVEIVP